MAAPAQPQTGSIGGVERPPEGELAKPADARRVLVGMAVTLVVLGVALTFYCFQPGGPAWGGMAVGVVVGGAALGVGGLFGLLFGIPRSLQRPADSGGPSGVPSPSDSQERYRPNTNLEEISDWLTKIIVGVSLTQLGTIRSELGVIVSRMALGFGPGAMARPFTAGLLAVASVAGFIAGYLLARLYLPRALLAADVLEIAERASRKAVQTVVDQQDADARALRLVEAALSTDKTAARPSDADLADALARVSQSAGDLIFERAAKLRHQTLGDDKESMARTIPIFRSLLKASWPGPRHRLHAQLGYALKDQVAPDDSGAIDELTTAIKERDRLGDPDWRIYEFNRAVSRSRLDMARGASPSDPKAKSLIIDDLRAAQEDPWVRTMTLRDPDLKEWAARNEIALAKLSGRDPAAGRGSG